LFTLTKGKDLNTLLDSNKFKKKNDIINKETIKQKKDYQKYKPDKNINLSKT